MDAPPPGDRGFLADRPLATSLLHMTADGRRFHAPCPPAVEQFDVTRYDLVISIRHGVPGFGRGRTARVVEGR